MDEKTRIAIRDAVDREGGPAKISGERLTEIMREHGISKEQVLNSADAVDKEIVRLRMKLNPGINDPNQILALALLAVELIVDSSVTSGNSGRIQMRLDHLGRIMGLHAQDHFKKALKAGD